MLVLEANGKLDVWKIGTRSGMLPEVRPEDCQRGDLVDFFHGVPFSKLAKSKIGNE